MIQLKRLGHVLLKVADVEISKAFYADLLGFEVVEQDPVHGGVFMTLGEHGHTIDLSPVDDPDDRPAAGARIASECITLRSRWIASRP